VACWLQLALMHMKAQESSSSLSLQGPCIQALVPLMPCLAACQEHAQDGSHTMTVAMWAKLHVLWGHVAWAMAVLHSVLLILHHCECVDASKSLLDSGTSAWAVTTMQGGLWSPPAGHSTLWTMPRSQAVAQGLVYIWHKWWQSHFFLPGRRNQETLSPEAEDAPLLSTKLCLQSRSKVICIKIKHSRDAIFCLEISESKCIPPGPDMGSLELPTNSEYGMQWET